MKKKITLMVAILLVFTMIATACGESDPSATEANGQDESQADSTTSADGEPVMSEKIVVAISAMPPTLDMMQASAAATATMGFHIFEQLIIFNAESEITPQLATSWESNDNDTEFTFKLKEGVTFHDGSAFTSEDAKASLERYQRMGYRKDSVFADLISIETPDDTTLVITLSQSSPLFLYDLSLPGMGPIIMLPSEVCDSANDYPNLTDDKLIGTGPYMMSENVADDHITLKRFADFVPDTGIAASGFAGEKHVWFETVEFKVAPEKATRLNGLIAGEYQYAEELDITNYEKLNSTSGVRPEIISPSWIPIVIINTMEGPMADPKVRQAMLMALDDEMVMLGATGDNQDIYSLESSLFYTYQQWYSDVGDTKYNQKDIEGAKALLEEAGYNGETILWATTKDYDWMYQVAVVVQQQLAAIGMNIELQINDWPTQADLLVNNSRSKDWDLFSTGMSLFDVIDPTGLNGLLMKDTLVLPYESDEMDGYMKEGMSSSDVDIRKAAYNKMQALLYEDLPWIVFGKMNSLYGASDKLAGDSPWFVTRMWNVWLEE